MGDSINATFVLPLSGAEVAESISGGQVIRECLAAVRLPRAETCCFFFSDASVFQVISKHNVRQGEYVLYLLPDEEHDRPGSWLNPEKRFSDLHITKSAVRSFYLLVS